MKDPRYDGKPLLRLTELWVLWAIGEIDGTDEAQLSQMEPNLQKTFGHGGAWHQVIEGALSLPPDLADQLRGMWQRNLEIAQKQGVSAPREMFAGSIADQIVGSANS